MISDETLMLPADDEEALEDAICAVAERHHDDTDAIRAEARAMGCPETELAQGWWFAARWIVQHAAAGEEVGK